MIPFNKPAWIGTELQRIGETFTVHGHLAGGGPFGKQCEALLEKQLGQRTLLVTSCTHALEMAALLLEIQPGDEVIVPSYTFVSTATAFALRGARIVFVDVDPSGNLDIGHVAAALSSRTRAVVAVHYAGNSCDLKRLLEICGKVPLVEDAAQALGSSLDERPLGSFGALGAFSFHETKNIGCGEGGALTIRNEHFIERAEYIRDKGTNRRRFMSGMVDKYTWVDLGSSYALSDLNAAYLSVQLQEQARINARRKAVYEVYRAALSGPLDRIEAYVVGEHPLNTPNHHLFGIVFPRGDMRDRFIARMSQHGIMTPFHYVALHLSPMGQRYHPSGRRLPNAEKLTACLVRLPLFFNITDSEVAEVTGRALESIGDF
jgi:dTDP-4-amino-4,6-dideoxygalactose transaminase